MFPSSYHFQELLPMTKVSSMQKVKVRGQRSRSQRSQPNLTISVSPSWYNRCSLLRESAKWAVGYRLFYVVKQDCFSVASSMTAVSTNLRVLCGHLCLLWPMWSCTIYIILPHVDRPSKSPMWIQEYHVIIYIFCSPCEHQSVSCNYIW